MPSEVLFNTKFPIYKNELNNGNIDVHSSMPFDAICGILDGVFSFTLYYQVNQVYKNVSDFTDAVLVQGLSLYIKLLHDETKNDRLVKWGLVIYTDIRTFQYIKKLYPFKLYPKLIIAVVMWPYYAESDGNIESSILRCMRYHAMELFPTNAICIRDSDTIFHVALAYYVKHKECEEQLSHLIRLWELEFLTTWVGSYSEIEAAAFYKNQLTDIPYIVSDIILGTSKGYFTEWHMDIPFPTPFKDKAIGKYKLKGVFEDTANNMKYTGKGLYAGFVNIARDKRSISTLWTQCVKFLFERYYMMDNSDGTRIITDYFADKILGTPIGKDERLLIFVFLKHVFSHIYFLYIEYLISDNPVIKLNTAIEYADYPSELIQHNLIRPGYIPAAIRKKLNGKYTHDYFRHIYNKIRIGYKKYLPTIGRNSFYNNIYKASKSDDRENIFNKFFLQKAKGIPNKKVYTLKRVKDLAKLKGPRIKDRRQTWKNIISS